MEPGDRVGETSGTCEGEGRPEIKTQKAQIQHKNYTSEAQAPLAGIQVKRRSEGRSPSASMSFCDRRSWIGFACDPSNVKSSGVTLARHNEPLRCRYISPPNPVGISAIAELFRFRQQ